MPYDLRRPDLPDTPEMWGNIETRVRLRAKPRPRRTSVIATRLQPVVGSLAVIAAIVVVSGSINANAPTATTGGTAPAIVTPADRPLEIRIPPEDLTSSPATSTVVAATSPPGFESRLPTADVLMIRSARSTPQEPAPSNRWR